MNIRPVGDHIVVSLIEENDTTASGIILPDAAKEKPERGRVVAVGPGRQLDNGGRASMEVKGGDTVLFKKYAPDEFTIDGDKVYVIESSDVIGILE